MTLSLLNIREASPEDGPAIARILHDLGWYEGINTESIAKTQDTISSKIMQCLQEQTHTILVAELPGQGVVGYVSVHWFPHLALGYDGYISELFLHPSTTGQGIGSRLLAQAEMYARRRGCTRLTLMNMRHRESYQRGFYTKQGWIENSSAAIFMRKIEE